MSGPRVVWVSAAPQPAKQRQHNNSFFITISPLIADVGLGQATDRPDATGRVAAARTVQVIASGGFESRGFASAAETVGAAGAHGPHATDEAALRGAGTGDRQRRAHMGARRAVQAQITVTSGLGCGIRI